MQGKEIKSFRCASCRRLLYRSPIKIATGEMVCSMACMRAVICQRAESGQTEIKGSGDASEIQNGQSG